MIIYCVSNTYATRIFQEFDDMVTAYFCDFGDDIKLNPLPTPSFWSP